MTTYTVGFAFSLDRQFVALIEKQRPKWQAGQLNGIGGHVEYGEILPDAQSREFFEETGVRIPASSWRVFATLLGPDWYVRCFVTFTDAIFDTKTITDEAVKVLPVRVLDAQPVITNLKYLVPLALDDEQIGIPRFNYGPRVAKAAAPESLETVLETSGEVVSVSKAAY